MSGAHPHHDPIEDNIDTHPVKLAIGIAVGAIAVVIGIILLAQFAVGIMPLSTAMKSWSSSNWRSRASAWLTAEGVMASSRAAALTLRWRMIASNTRNRLRSTRRNCPCSTETRFPSLNL